MMFRDHWLKQHGPPLENLAQTPTVAPKGGAVVRIIGSSPSHTVPRYYVTLISAIRSAEKNVTASAAYFVPTHDELEALCDAAPRGVDVELLLPDHSDSALSMAVGRSHYGALLKAGVKIYETHGLVLHSKMVTVDGVWSVIGSSNFDHRSVIFNDEVDAVAIGGDTAQDLEAMFEDDRKAAHPIDLATWSRRPMAERLKETYARVWQNWL
jgi:cardiolipin synthase